MKVSKLISNIGVNKKNCLISVIILYLGSLLLTIPFINILDTNTFWICALICMGFALGISVLVFFVTYVFCEIQPYIDDLKFKELFIKSGIVTGIEFAIFACFSFLLLLIPPIFVAVGVVVLVSFCALNIYLIYNDLKERAKDRQSFFKFVKVFHITIITLIVLIWLIC